MLSLAPTLLLLHSLPAFGGKGDTPLASAVVVWTEAGLPSADVQAKIAQLTGGGQHVTWGEVAFQPGDRTQADRLALAAVQTAADAGRKRMDDFEAEPGIAQALRTTVDAVALIADEGDRSVLVHGLALESIAVMRSFPEARFAVIDDAAPFRIVVGDQVTLRPLADLVALDPDRVWTREDLGDGQLLARVQEYQAAVKSLPMGVVHFCAMPPGVSLIVDGRTLPPGVGDLPVWPGHHYAAVRVGNRIAGRAEFNVASGATVEVPALVAGPDIDAARALILAGKLDAMPAAVARALEAVGAIGGKAPRVYVAAVDAKGVGHVLPWTPGAVLVGRKAVTVMLVGDVGGGFFNSAAFAQQGGAALTAAQFGPQLSGQLGVYNFYISAGGTVAITPGQRFASGGSEEAKASGGSSYAPDLVPAGVRAWGGVGAYLPRPARGVPLLSVGVNYGEFFPGSTGFGGGLTFGAPVSDGKTWFRFSVDGFRTVQMPLWPQPGTVSYVGAFRIGFGRLL